MTLNLLLVLALLTPLCEPEPTNDIQAIGEVLDDMRRDHPMRRLLQGEVGCGKTIVAYAALFHAAAVTLLFLVTIFAAGCFWGWLREKYGTVWPALLGHAGATAGYMIVYWTRFTGGR